MNLIIIDMHHINITSFATNPLCNFYALHIILVIPYLLVKCIFQCIIDTEIFLKPASYTKAGIIKILVTIFLYFCLEMCAMSLRQTFQHMTD